MDLITLQRRNEVYSNNVEEDADVDNRPASRAVVLAMQQLKKQISSRARRSYLRNWKTRW